MTKRLLEGDTIIMRGVVESDSPMIMHYAADIEIADNTFVPHPYAEENARDFITMAREGWENESGYVFAICRKDTGEFVGAMGIHPEQPHNYGEVGYWIGKPHWGNGYATQALRLIIQFGFEELELNRIQAGYFPQNAASGRVMEKVGMQYEGTFRQAMRHRTGYKDVIRYAILREDYDAQNS